MKHRTSVRPTLSRRQLLATAAAAGLSAGLAPLARAAGGDGSKPNILWLMADDLGFADTGITGLRGMTTPVIIVSNEVGMGIVPDNRLARIFRDIAGQANQIIAAAADQAWLVASGIPLKLK